MERAQETKKIIAARLQAPHHQIEDLGECSSKVWRNMASLGMYSAVPLEGEVRFFMDRVRSGLNHALGLPGPSLIVAHGGVHWAAWSIFLWMQKENGPPRSWLEFLEV